MSGQGGATKLRVVKGAQHPATDIYAADKAKALDLDRWERCHIASDRSPAVEIKTPPIRNVLGWGVRTERRDNR